MLMAAGLTVVLAILALATVLVLLDLRAEWQRRRRRKSLERVLANALARDHIIHDRPEETTCDIRA